MNKPTTLFFLVSAIHILLFSTFFITKTSPPPTQPNKICVKEFHIQEQTHTTSSPASALLAKITPPSKPKVVKKETPKKKNVTKKEAPPKKSIENQQEALALLQKSLSQTHQAESKTEKKVLSLQSEGLSWKGSFEEELVLYLQTQLSVPEPGTITLELTLQASGKLLAMEITKCAVQSNRSYLEKSLPALIYPSFAHHFPKEKERRFALTFHVN